MRRQPDAAGTGARAEVRTVEPRYRPDIDGLRALAVVSVVVFHAFPRSLRGGFIGVDGFFVISGFLITGIILARLDTDSFSFADFYARRVRRLFPALILVLAASLAGGWFVLLPDELERLGHAAAAGAAFLSNFLHWREAGYFDPSADTKPLLHLWSLAIEEQFYIVWPLLLWLAARARSHLLAITGVIGVASFAINVVSISSDAVGAFYSPSHASGN